MKQNRMRMSFLLSLVLAGQVQAGPIAAPLYETSFVVQVQRGARPPPAPHPVARPERPPDFDSKKPGEDANLKAEKVLTDEEVEKRKRERAADDCERRVAPSARAVCDSMRRP